MRIPHYLSSTLLLGLASRLEQRADNQELTNPDNEPTYKEATSENDIGKSRVLSGVGPDAAINRYFDWDESCSDVTQREKIVAAWDNFQPLVTSASKRLTDLKAKLPSQPVKTTGDPDTQNVAFIKVEDPAYTQMFKARDIGLEWVIDSYDKITTNLKNFAGRAKGKPAALRFICNADDHVKNGAGEPYCGSEAAAVQAMTLVPQGLHNTFIELRYRFSKASSITFCPVFFDDSKFPSIKSVWDNDQIQPDLNNVDCRERIILHEYMHLPWVRNMAPRPDYTGYQDVNDVASRLAWGTIKSTPDCYAWYAIYSAYNNKDSGCGRDIWPAGVDKLVAT